MSTFIIATIVGLFEFAPGMCQMELLNPDGTINTSHVKCTDVVPTELVTIPYRAPGGPWYNTEVKHFSPMQVKNWQHHSKKEQKRKLKPQALRAAKARRHAFKRQLAIT